MSRTLVLCLLSACSSSHQGDDSADDLWADVTESSGSFDETWSENWASHATAVGDGALLIEALEAGEIMELSWAQQSDVACFPGTQSDLFAGPHRLFVLLQAQSQDLEIRVEPEPDVDISIYTLKQSPSSYMLPPDTETAVRCETSLSGGPGETEDLSLSGAGSDYNIVLGVAGVEGQASGRFLLEVSAGD